MPRESAIRSEGGLQVLEVAGKVVRLCGAAFQGGAARHPHLREIVAEDLAVPVAARHRAGAEQKHDKGRVKRHEEDRCQPPESQEARVVEDDGRGSASGATLRPRSACGTVASMVCPGRGRGEDPAEP